MVVAVHQTDTVGTDEGRSVLLTGVEDALLEFRSRLRLLAETGGDDHKGPDAFLLTEVVHIVGTEFGSHYEYGHLRLRDVLHIVVGLDALHFVFLGVHDAQVATETAVLDIPHNSATGLMHVVGATDHDDAPRV